MQNHQTYCNLHAAQHIRYPTEEDGSVLKFTQIKKCHKAHFWLAVDFECFLVKTPNAAGAGSGVLHEHVPSGFACYRVTDLPKYRTEPHVYSGPDVMEKFYEHLFKECNEIDEILSKNLPMNDLTPQQLAEHKNADKCPYCRQYFTPKNWKVFHHDHLTGEYIAAACNNCNLQLKSAASNL
jgi:hypothetical protein